jgi:hypothetical protein
MNTTLLRARDVEAYALSTLTIAPDSRAQDATAGNRTTNIAPAAAKFARTRRTLLMPAIFGIALAAVAFGLLNTRLSPSTAAHMHQSPKAVAATNEPRAARAEPAMMKIVPANVLDPSSSVFMGTGDGSNGSWARP